MRAFPERFVLVRAYLREIGAQLALVLGGTAFLVALVAAVRASAASQGAPLWLPLALVPLIVGNALPYLIPATLLTAVVLTYSRMAADGEATALRAAGLGTPKLLGPALLAGLLVALASYPLSAGVLPEVYSQMRALSYRLRFAALENTDPPASELSFRGLHLSWARRSPDGSFRDVLLIHEPGGAGRVYSFDPGVQEVGGDDHSTPPRSQGLRLRADIARMRVRGSVVEFQFEGMRSFSQSGEGGAWSARNPGLTVVRLDLADFGGRPESARKGDDYSSPELRKLLAAGKLEPDRSRSFRYTLWRRFSTALAALPLAAIGALLGWSLRRRGFLGAFAAAFGVLLVVFYPLYALGNGLQQSGSLDPALAALLPPGGLLLAVGVLVWLGRRRR